MFSKEFPHKDTPVLDDQQKFVLTSCVDIGCCLEDLPRTMADKDKRLRECQRNPSCWNPLMMMMMMMMMMHVLICIWDYLL